MIEVSVVGLGIHPAASAPLLLLQERDGPRLLSLGIGPLEAQAIALPLQGFQPPRPLTHDVFVSVVAQLGGQLRRVEITELLAETFYARLVLGQAGQEHTIDIRPSDAIALAVRTATPIYVAGEVLDQAGIVPEQMGEPVEAAESAAEDEASALAPFKEFIDTLNLEDLDTEDPERRD